MASKCLTTWIRGTITLYRLPPEPAYHQILDLVSPAVRPWSSEADDVVVAR